MLKEFVERFKTSFSSRSFSILLQHFMILAHNTPLNSDPSCTTDSLQRN